MVGDEISRMALSAIIVMFVGMFIGFALSQDLYRGRLDRCEQMNMTISDCRKINGIDD